MYSTVTPLRKQQIEILRRRFPYILISASGKDDDDVYTYELLKYMYKFEDQILFFDAYSVFNPS